MAGLRGSTLVPGMAEGEGLALAEPLSFWGGYDAATGLVIDRRHPDRGRSGAGKILVLAASRGSSSGSSVLAEAIRAGTGPAGIMVMEKDAILTVGAMVAAELYGLACPIVVVSAADHRIAAGAARLRIAANTAEARIDVNPSRA